MEKALQIQKQVIDILGTDEVYLVGGSVRDLVMSNDPKDYDFCTPMLPEEMEAKIKAAGRRPYGIGKKFGTMGFKVEVHPPNEGMAERFGEAFGLKLVPQYEYVEVTTFRSEVYTSKNRKPEVKFVPSLSEDLARRDFTMNAMVLRPDGTIYDPYGGKLDIHSKRIKTVGMPKERINEDPLRMLRAARFAARYGFEIDPNFIGKARQLADRIYDVSVERWVQELDKLITSGHARYGMEQLEAMGLRKLIIPEALPNQWLFDREFNSDMAWSALLWNTGSPYSDNKETAKKISKYINSGICQRLKFSNVRTEIVQNPQRLAFCTDLYNEQIDIILGGS